jgi:importin subunit alpha-6/7
LRFIYRDLILQADGLTKLSNLVLKSNIKNIIKHGTWAVSNLCRGKPLPSFTYTQIAIPVLVKAITVESDFEILTDALWALSYLSDGDEARIQMVIEAQIIPGL